MAYKMSSSEAGKKRNWCKTGLINTEITLV